MTDCAERIAYRGEIKFDAFTKFVNEAMPSLKGKEEKVLSLVRSAITAYGKSDPALTEPDRAEVGAKDTAELFGSVLAPCWNILTEAAVELVDTVLRNAHLVRLNVDGMGLVRKGDVLDS